MSVPTPKDRFGIPAVLGNYNGNAVPVKVEADGSICVSLTPGGAEVRTDAPLEFVKSLSLDLSVARSKERHEISFDGLAVGSLKGSFFMYPGESAEDKKCTIDKSLWLGASAEAVFFSNAAQAGYAEIWFFKRKEAI